MYDVPSNPLCRRAILQFLIILIKKKSQEPEPDILAAVTVLLRTYKRSVPVPLLCIVIRVYM